MDRTELERFGPTRKGSDYRHIPKILLLLYPMHMVQLMPLHPKPRRLLPSFNPDWFYLPRTGLPRLSWKKGR